MKRNSSKTKPGSNRDGFTLVELVVVIAVLAILAGVGAVAYNGYIEYAKKGLDRQLVGEVMHALELADYADPGLFGENGGAMVVISEETADASTGKGGLQAVGGLEKTDRLKAALKDSLGDLGSISLSYDKWDGTPDMGVFKDLSSSAIDTYVENNKAASFANNVDDLWDTVKSYTDGTLDGFAGPDYLGKAVESFAGWTEADAVKFQNMWKSGEFTNADGTTLKGRAIAATAARNYSFYSYALSQVSGDMLEELNNFKSNFSDFAMGPFDSVRIVETYFSNIGWNQIMESYRNNQAPTDALAFLGMMDAAGAVGNSLETSVTDEETGKQYVSNDDYKEAMTKYVDMVSNILSGRVNYKDIATLADSVTGNAVVINVTKANGKLNFDVIPDDANPRESTGSGNGSTSGDTGNTGTCDKTHSSSSISAADVYSGTVSAIDLCLISDGYGSCTIAGGETADGQASVSVLNMTIKDVTGVVKVQDSGGKGTITAIGGGTATVSVTLEFTDYSTWEPIEVTKTLTVNVHGDSE